MSKKIVKKTKLKKRNFLVFLLIIGLIAFLIYYYVNIPIKNIIIKNNSYLEDDYILVLADIKDYPSYFKTSTHKIRKEILDSPFISSVKVERKFFNIIKITIEEKKPLFYTASNNLIYFSDETSIKQDISGYNFRIPRIINDIPESLMERYVKAMDKLNADTLSRISDIKYDPNDIDNERFLLYMDDGNLVYLTLTKISKINYYNTVLEQLEGKHGILYLDNGNHFKIME